MKESQITLQWAELKVWNGCKNPAIVQEKVRDDAEKKCEWRTSTNEEQQHNEEQQQKEDQKWNEEQQHHKNLTGG